LNSPTVLVTGSTDGLGKAVAMDLAHRGANVLIHGRDPERIARTVAEIHRVASSRCAVRSYRADFASLEQVRALAGDILAQEARLDVLLNNAGIGTTIPGGGVRMTSGDGYELRFAVNYLAPYLLTHLLVPLLRRSAPARIINVSSIGQAPIEFDDPMLLRHYDGVRAYCQSKLAQVLFTLDLAQELDPSEVTVTALHPATYMPTKIVVSPISTLEEGVAATTRLAMDADLRGITGRFYDGAHEARANFQAYEADARRQLRVLSDHLVGFA